MSILDKSKIMKAHGCDAALELVLTQLSGLGGKNILVQNDGFAVENVVLACGATEVVAFEVVRNWLDSLVPIEVVAGYDLPSYIGSNTLVVICDMAGTNPQIKTVLEQASERGSRVEVITLSGQLASETKELSRVQSLSSIQTELATFSLVEALLRVFIGYKLVDSRYWQEFKKGLQQVSPEFDNWKVEVPHANNQAKQLADSILGKTPVFYGGAMTSLLAVGWKISLNQLAKNLAWTGRGLDLGSSERLGWTSHPIEKPFLPVLIISNFERSETLESFEFAQHSLSGRWPQPRVIHLVGKSLIAQLMWGCVLADATSVYLAALNNVKPFSAVSNS